MERLFEQENKYNRHLRFTKKSYMDDSYVLLQIYFLICKKLEK